MTFKKIVVAAFLVSCSIALVNAGRRSIATDTKQATCAHIRTKPAEITSTVYPGLILIGRVCESCEALITKKEEPGSSVKKF